MPSRLALIASRWNARLEWTGLVLCVLAGIFLGAFAWLVWLVNTLALFLPFDL